MALRSKQSGQRPLISQMCVATELAITAIFERKNPYPLAPASQLDEASAPAPVDIASTLGPMFRMRFN